MNFSNTEARIQRFIILIPALILYYFNINLLAKSCDKLNINLVNKIFYFQFLSHIILSIFNLRCTPDENKLCSNFAFLIGLFYFIYILPCINFKNIHISLFISLFIIFYMILSHIISIYPLKNILIYKNLKLPIFNINTYILIFSNLLHERKLNKKINKLLINKNINCIIDCGAYIGDFTLFLAKNNPNKIFYSIEPSSNNYKFIELIKKLNNLNNLVIYNNLISNEINTYSSLNPNKPSAEYKVSLNGKIKSITLDSLYKEKKINSPNIIHIDVEGMELEVLEGSINIIKLFRPIIIVEFLKKHNAKNNIIHNMLKKLNYSPEVINESCNVIDIIDITKCRNLIYYPI